MRQALTDQQIHLLQIIAREVPRAMHDQAPPYYADLELLWRLELIEPVGNEFVLCESGAELLAQLDGAR